MNIVFMGTPQIAKEVLEYLVEKHYNIQAVVTKEDTKKGRGQKIMYTPVKEYALEKNIPILQPTKLKDEDFVQTIQKLNPDVIVVVAYGKLIPESIYTIPKYGTINIHGSLLPKYRGAAPIQRAILNGDKTSGVSIMYIEKELDAGDVLYAKEFDISNDSSKTLFAKMGQEGKKALVHVLEKIQKEGKLEGKKQDLTKVTYAPKIEKEEQKIDFNKTTDEVLNKIRGLYDFMIATATLNGKDIKIHKAKKVTKEEVEKNNLHTLQNAGDYLITKKDIFVKTKDGYIAILELQLPGKKALTKEQFLCGNSDF